MPGISVFTFILDLLFLSKYGQSIHDAFNYVSFWNCCFWKIITPLPFFIFHILKWAVFPLGISLLLWHLQTPWLIHFNLPSVFFALVRLFSLWSGRFPSGKTQWFLFSLPFFFVLSASSGTVGDINCGAATS
jgi:hypothetical protein